MSSSPFPSPTTAPDAAKELGVEIDDRPEIRALDIISPDLSKWFARYATAYGVHPSFLPFAGHAANPIEVLCEIREVIESKEPTVATIRVKQISDKSKFSPSAVQNTDLQTLMTFLGSWPSPNELASDSRADRWVNPQYKTVNGEMQGSLGMYADLQSDKGNHLIDPEIRRKRIDWIERGHVFGLDGYQIARRMAVPRQNVFTTGANNGIISSELRRSGRILMARTWKTANQWGVPYRTIADATGRSSRNSVSWLVSEYASEFEPPVDPSPDYPNQFVADAIRKSLQRQ